MNCEKSFVNILVLTMLLFSLCEARGGRRGGSFGGIFGSWRKYKKPSSAGGNSRRIVSSSPMHTPITKAWHENKKSGNSEKIQKYNYHGYNTPPLPKGGTYYQNTAALPGNAIFVPQSPPRGAEFGNFLTGYLTGRLLTMGFPTSHYHVSHIYRDSQTVVDSTISQNTDSQVVDMSSQQDMSTEKVFNSTLIAFTTTIESFIEEENSTSSQASALSTTEPPAPSYGIICIPMLLNETQANGAIVQNERTVCYPAPAPFTIQKDLKSKPVEIAGDIMEH